MVAGAPNWSSRSSTRCGETRRRSGSTIAARPVSSKSALRARDSGDVVLAGPVDLVQGGRALIARFPVFTHPFDARTSLLGPRFRGHRPRQALSRLRARRRDLPIDVAITGTDGLGKDGVHFFGDAATERDDPVTVNVRVPSGSWRIAAIPKGGWAAALPSRWLLRLAILAGGLVIVVPTWLIGRLVEERRAHLLRLRDRERELERLSRRLELALDASKVGVWEINIAGPAARLGRPDERALRLSPRRGVVAAIAHWRARLDESDLARAIEDFEAALQARPLRIRNSDSTLGDGRSGSIRAIGKVYFAPDGSMQDRRRQLGRHRRCRLDRGSDSARRR